MGSTISAISGPECRLFKVHCYRGKKDKQVWYECECTQTKHGVAWSPSIEAVLKKAAKHGYTVINPTEPITRLYRST